MNFVGNLLKREPRRVKTTDAEGEEEKEEVSEKIDSTRAIKVLYMILMKYEEIEPSLKGFFDQLYLAAQPFERNGPYEEINGGVHVLSSCFIK